MRARLTFAGRGSRPIQAWRWGSALGMVALAGSAQAAGDCAALVGVTTDDATITSAAIVEPPSTIGGAAVTVRICRVQGVARPSSDSEIKFEVWLPPSAADWTRRLKVNGTGGYAGSIPYARLSQDAGDGFVDEPGAGGDGVLQVRPGRITVAEGGRDATLRPRGVRFGGARPGEDEDGQDGRGLERGEEAGGAAADDHDGETAIGHGLSVAETLSREPVRQLGVSALHWAAAACCLAPRRSSPHWPSFPFAAPATPCFGRRRAASARSTSRS